MTDNDNDNDKDNDKDNDNQNQTQSLIDHKNVRVHTSSCIYKC